MRFLGWLCLGAFLPFCIECVEAMVDVISDLPQLVPFVVLAFVSHFRNLVLHVILPLFDVVSDIIAGYFYFDKETYIITGFILLFVLLPHILLSLAVIWEMIIDVGAFDEYPKQLVQFYKSKPTVWNILNNTIKFLTLPFFTLFNFLQFFVMLLAMGFRLIAKMFCYLSKDFIGRVGQRHPERIREDNVRQDGWAKITLLELFFETIPQLMTQVAALVALHKDPDQEPQQSYAVISSIVVSILNFSYQSYTLAKFMTLTHLSLFNTVRYMFSSALDFFPVFNLFKNTADRVLLQFYDNPILLELWGPLKMVIRRNTSLKVLTIYLEDLGDWMDMCFDLLDAVAENDRLKMDSLDLCVEATEPEDVDRVIARMPELKTRIYALLEKGIAKEVYLLVDSMANIGIAEVPAEQLNTLSLTVDGFKWSWDWPGGKSSKIEYCIRQLTTRRNED